MKLKILYTDTLTQAQTFREGVSGGVIFRERTKEHDADSGVFLQEVLFPGDSDAWRDYIAFIQDQNDRFSQRPGYILIQYGVKVQRRKSATR